MRNFRQRKAFTIVEMVIVIAVIAVLAAVMIPTISGVIAKANHNADLQFVSSLNIQLAVWTVDNGEIKNESDLRRAINEIHDDDTFYDTLEPKSGNQGYHFWYDAVDKVVVLSTYDALGVDPSGSGRQTGAHAWNNTHNLMVNTPYAVTLLGNNENNSRAGAGGIFFSRTSPRSIEKHGKNFFFMDRGNSEMSKMVDGFENVADPNDYKDLIDELGKLVTAGNDSVAAAIQEKITQTAFYTEGGVFRGKADDVHYVHKNAKHYDDALVYEYIAEEEDEIKEGKPQSEAPVTSNGNQVEIDVPAGTSVNMGALVNLTNAKLFIDATLEELDARLLGPEEILILEAFSFEGVIELADGKEYVVKEGYVYNAPYNEGDAYVAVLGVNSVDEIHVTYNDNNANKGQDADYLYNGTLYLAYDFESTILSVDKCASQVKWAVNSPNAPIEVEESTGKITVSGAPDAANTTATVTATLTLPNGSTLTDSINVRLVFPTEVEWEITNSLEKTDSKVKLNYTGDTNNYIISLGSVLYTQAGFVEMNNEPTVSVTAGEGTLFTVKENEDGTYTLTLDPDHIEDNSQTLTIACGEYVSQSYTITVVDNSAVGLKTNQITETVAMGATYLFRVGNGNTFTLGQLFSAKEANKAVVVNGVTIYDASLTDEEGKRFEIDGTGGFNATYTKNPGDNWSSSAVDFSGTGVAIIVIETSKGPAELTVEVVDGTNYKDGAELSGSTSTNIVLIGNVTIKSNETLTLNNAALYGNGYTFDVTMGANTGKGGETCGLIILNSSILDNVKVLGAQYTTVGDKENGGDNVRATVLAKGDSAIYNSYITNCVAPVRIASAANVYIKNTTLWGGSFANLDIRGGTVTVENLTTFNQVTGNPNPTKGAIGLGIAFWYENVSSDTKLIVQGNLTQYNTLSKTEASQYVNSTASSYVGNMFINGYTYSDGSVQWTNTGIISLSESVGASNIQIDQTNGYTGMPVSMTVIISKIDCYYATKTPTAANYKSTPTEWVPTQQNPVAPIANPNYTLEGNYQAKEDGSNEYCYYGTTEKKLLISFSEGGEKVFNPWILDAKKHGKDLTFSVTIDGKNYNKGDTITFTQAGEYTMVFTYTDPYNYAIQGGALVQDTLKYTKTVIISVTTVKLAAKAPVFTFHGYTGISTTPATNFTGTKTLTDNKSQTWIMPDGTVTANTKTTTINGVSVICPVVYVDFKDNSSDFNWLYPYFTGVTIQDYANGGTAATATIIANQSTASKPTGFTVISGDATFSSGATSGKHTADTKLSAGTYKNMLGWQSSPKGADTSEDTIYIQYSYNGQNGTTYYYCIAYIRGAHKKPSSCVTGDTLVTLADGTQKEIQYVTYEDQLLVWNHFTGKYDVVPAAIIFNHGYADNTVIKLNFSDGTQVKMINLHQFLDADLKQYVSINADNVAQYVGHNFVKQNGDSYTTVTLESYEISEEYIEAYGIISALHYNILVEGMFSTDFMLPDYDLFNYFTIGDGMIYDAEQMQEDIEKYGLYTYEDFADYLTYEQFVGFNVQYFKIAVGRGLYTYEGILDLIDEYLNA